MLQDVGSDGLWTRAWMRQAAGRLRVSTTVLELYLRAVRRTVGLPLGHPSYAWGPLVRPAAWVAKARASGSWGPFQFLVRGSSVRR